MSEVTVKSKYPSTVSFSMESMTQLLDKEFTHVHLVTGEKEITLTRSELTCWWSLHRTWKKTRTGHPIKVYTI